MRPGGWQPSHSRNALALILHFPNHVYQFHLPLKKIFDFMLVSFPFVMIIRWESLQLWLLPSLFTGFSSERFFPLAAGFRVPIFQTFQKCFNVFVTLFIFFGSPTFCKSFRHIAIQGASISGGSVYKAKVSPSHQQKIVYMHVILSFFVQSSLECYISAQTLQENISTVRQ